MEITALDKAAYAGKSFTVRYTTTCYLDIRRSGEGFVFETKSFAAPVEMHFEDRFFNEWLDEPVAYGAFAEGALLGYVEGFLETWLTRILLNVCKDELRRRKRRVDWETLPETAAEEFDALPLRQAVLRLPEELKAVVILRYFTGLTQEETARALDVPRGTVSTRQRRALELLRLELSVEVES